METCRAISKLLPQYVKFPSTDVIKDIVQGFEDYWGFPPTAGAVDDHTYVIKPKQSASDYYNRKGYYSIIVQGIVDYRGLFLYVYIGWPGKAHDARVFVNSSLYQKGCSGTLLPDLKRKVDVPLGVTQHILLYHG